MPKQEDPEGNVPRGGNIPSRENRDVDDIGLEEAEGTLPDESGVFHLEDIDLPEVTNKTTAEGGSIRLRPVERENVTLKKELEKKEQEAKKQEERYLYLRSDFENYKKRIQKEQLEQSKYANEKLLREVLVVLDDLERAILHFDEKHDFEKIAEGLALVSKQFLSFLNRFGVAPIDSLNKPFDPTCHQAVGQVSRPDLNDGAVTEEIQKGYMLYDRLIRPAFVMIAKNNAIRPAGATYPSTESTEGNGSASCGGTVDSNV